MDDLRKEILELRQHYKNTFYNPSGALVFYDLIVRSGFFDEINHENQEMLGRRNMMLEVIKIIGAFEENPQRVSEAVCNTLLQQPIMEAEGNTLE